VLVRINFGEDLGVCTQELLVLLQLEIKNTLLKILVQQLHWLWHNRLFLSAEFLLLHGFCLVK
jgi:hypothetical protein